MKRFLKNNLVYFSHFLLSIFLELSTIIILTNSIMIREPWLLLSISTALFFIYNLISNVKAKNILLNSIFIIQIIINIFCVILFENTGTLFDFSMIQLATESTDFLSTITINWWYIVFVFLLLTVYLILEIWLSKYIDKSHKFKYQNLICSILLGSTIIGQGAIIYFTNYINEERFVNSIYKDVNDKYANYGASGNFLNEIAKMLFFNNYNKLSYQEIDEFIYSEVSTPSSIHGISKDNNLITILVESFEWFSFVSDANAYPKGANLTEEQLDELYPNLRAFYNSSMVMNNHYSQNKTDISEDEAFLSSYPSSAYLSYKFPKNSYPYSTVNMLKSQDSSLTTSFFHSNIGSYYNREKVNKSMGFDNAYFVEEMEEKGYTNYVKLYGLGANGSMNMDSEMFEIMKDEMFKENERFYTHITTFTMHGNYIYRFNMQKHLDKMANIGVTIKNDYLRNYMAAVMDFDAAIGIMMEDLRSKNLLDNTTILLYSDHNTYMSELTYQVKNITVNNYNEENYIELYRVPFMLYDNNLDHQIINKFTTTSDIAPTILDLFGINYYTNLYYGNSIFSDNESILYSKAFDIFISDGMFYRNINNILFKREDITNNDIKQAEEKSLEIMKKIYYINHIFDYNYFNNEENYNKYINKINFINN